MFWPVGQSRGRTTQLSGLRDGVYTGLGTGMREARGEWKTARDMEAGDEEIDWMENVGDGGCGLERRINGATGGGEAVREERKSKAAGGSEDRNKRE